MGQSFDSASKKIGELLGSFERRVVAVPRFQRGYSWERAHVATFWSDVLGFSADYEKAPKSATYFFGPVVVQNLDEEISLLDGQQRLATVTILLAVIRDVARTLTFAKGNPGHDLAAEIKTQLIQKDESDPPFALRLGELDQEYFQRTVQSDPPEEVAPRLRSHELIRLAYKDLRDAVELTLAGLDSEAGLRRLKHLKDAVAKGMLVVAITVESEDDAYAIFETLNDRGLRLSVPDLLLNLLMRRAATDNERAKIRGRWNDVLEQMGRRDIDRFLRHLWLSRYGDLKTRGLFYELKDHLEAKQIKSLDFAESCALDSEYYVALLDQSQGIPKAARNSVAGLIKYLGVTSSLPMLLAGLQTLSDNDFSTLARFAAALAVRYSVVADLNPSTLESAFYTAARKMRAADDAKKASGAILTEALDELRKLWPGDEMVRAKAPSVVLSRAPALWILTQMAAHMQSGTGEVTIGEANLEHVFPRNPTAVHWPNKDELQPYLWRLGNLTILGEEFNRGASNKGYATKAANYYPQSELAMANGIPVQYSEWTPECIDRRSAEMAELLLSAFAASG